MIATDAFRYINVLDKAADASWIRSSCINNNIANVDTPGYKRKDIDFASVLKMELGRSKYTALDDKIKNLHKLLEKEKQSLIISIERRKKLLANEKYVLNAPKNIVETEKSRLKEEEEKLKAINEKLN